MERNQTVEPLIDPSGEDNGRGRRWAAWTQLDSPCVALHGPPSGQQVNRAGQRRKGDASEDDEQVDDPQHAVSLHGFLDEHCTPIQQPNTVASTSGHVRGVCEVSMVVA